MLGTGNVRVNKGAAAYARNQQYRQTQQNLPYGQQQRYGYEQQQYQQGLAGNTYQDPRYRYEGVRQEQYDPNLHSNYYFENGMFCQI